MSDGPTFAAPMPDAATFAPFPPRRLATYRADSIAEEFAVIAAYPPATGGEWAMVSQRLTGLAGGGQPVDLIEVRDGVGGTREVPFAIGSFYGTVPDRLADAAADAVETVMQQAVDFARENGPHHPGTLPRFPVPAPAYPGRVIVPLPLVAVNDARERGLYAPPRIVVSSWPAGEPVGVAESPFFSPEHWPPPRMGDWPPAAFVARGRQEMAAATARFGAIWGRLLTAWLTSADYPHRLDEAAEAVALLAWLDLRPMLEFYRAISPEFWAWISEG